jgi:D-sedoheptulose 7-phosphate isomerase
VERLEAEVARLAVEKAVADNAETARAVAALADEIVQAASIVVAALGAGGQVLLCGNGGSAADAQHLAAELSGRYLRERSPWPAIALHANTSALTAIANDYGFEEVFARQVAAHGRAGDALIAISTSGASPNVLRAIETAREIGMSVIGLSGGHPGRMAEGCDVCLAVAGSSTPRVQEGHILAGHVICGLVEDALS